MTGNKILTGTEYISLGLSVLGTVLASATGQIAYATSPLILSLFLNVAGRNNSIKRSSHNVNHQITSVENNLLESDRNYRRSIQKVNDILNEKANNNEIIVQEIKTIQNDLIQLKNSNRANEKYQNIAFIEEKLNLIGQQFNDSFKQQIDDFNKIIKDTRPNYQLIYDRQESRDVLIKALENAQKRIILVCPWITEWGANHELKNGSKGIVIELCEDFLDRGGQLDIGWGHLKDINQKEHISISRDKFIKIASNNKKDWAYNQIKKFMELEKKYQKCNLKLLGTHEKFLVCDRSFAMIGSHNFLTSNCYSSERELGLKTDDKNIIEDFINRFETAPSLDK